MHNGRAVGPDEIPVEFWKHAGRDAWVWLTKHFNVILRTAWMPDEWRESLLVPLFKGKGDIQSCENYRGIKLLSHTMKVWERVIEYRVRKEVCISENQRRDADAPVRRCERITVIGGSRGRGRPKKNWEEVIRQDLGLLDLTEDMALDRNLWRTRIRVAG
ncbi:unnamed protein product [Cuscuta campestris]|uniref:Uncharacterized protein n=1 Tax=Cuscuta campestris TaxID=132261 RepID=A0A484LQ84_9ASTE|nr:unnamed protein product [Cuscuta campestris]